MVTGYRFSYGGAQEYYGVTPDLCTLGKIIGGGFPLAAIAGKKEIMAHFDKEKVGSDGFLMQIGTLSGNPIASVAGLKTLEILRRPGSYEKLRQNGQRIMDFASKELSENNIDFKVVGDQTLFEIIFTNEEILNYRDVQKNDLKYKDSGIEQTWNFAHPNNKKVTGPLGNFKRMIKGASYQMMIDHLSHTITELGSSDKWAQFEVIILDKNKIYHKFNWQVEKYTMDGPLKDCWLTTMVSNPISLGSSI